MTRSIAFSASGDVFTRSSYLSDRSGISLYFLQFILNSGRILVNGSSFYCGNSTSNLCQLALKNDIPAQYVHPAQKQCNYAYTHPSAPQCDLKNGNFSLVSRYTESGSKTHTSLVTGSRKDPTFDNDIFSSKVDAFKELNMVSICSFFVVDFTLGGTSVDDSTSLFVHLGGYNSYASYTARKGTTRMIYYCGDLRDIACPVKHSNYSGNTGNIVCSYYAQLFSIALITPSFP